MSSSTRRNPPDWERTVKRFIRNQMRAEFQRLGLAWHDEQTQLPEALTNPPVLPPLPPLPPQDAAPQAAGCVPKPVLQLPDLPLAASTTHYSSSTTNAALPVPHECETPSTTTGSIWSTPIKVDKNKLQPGSPLTAESVIMLLILAKKIET
ncbi:unnamed protein product, partial [Amoebophrya sp. A25]|eukprot:GSA25T00014125001.1